MKLEELNLSIGQPLELIIVGQDYKRHQCKGELIGYKASKSLSIHLPIKPPQVLLRDKLPIEATVLLPNGTATFESEIEQLNEFPFLALQCEYPPRVEFERKRREVRIPVDTQVQVIGHTNIGMKTDSISGYALDVSFTGGRIVLEKELTNMVKKISVGLMLESPEIKRDMELMAVVRNESDKSDEHPECNFSYGIEFIDLEEIDRFFLRAYCLEQIQQENFLYCR